MNSIIPKARHALFFWIAAGYLVITLAYAFLIPAWEANDEMDHVANIEYILQQKRSVPLRWQSWHETHQPPFYYWLGAVWQRFLSIPAFTPAELTRTTGPMTAPNLQLAYLHTYTPDQRKAAIALHKLRLLSTLFGLGTVALTYIAALHLTQQGELAASAAGLVAFLPKFTVISASVTNDSLAVMLSSLGLVLALR